MKGLFEALIAQKISANQLGILVGIKHRISAPSSRVEFDDLFERKLIIRKPDLKLMITKNGEDLLNEFQNKFFSKKKSKPKKIFSSWEKEKIEEYRLLFPAGRPAIHGHLVRTNVKELEARFSWFQVNYPEYTWETILQATKNYVEKSAQDGYSHLQVSKYFIYKQESPGGMYRSDLASYCENLEIEDPPEQLYTATYNIR